jgi:hypothetical protein
VLEPEVVDKAERVWRRLEDHRPVLDIDAKDVINGVGIGGEEQGLRIHQA